MRPCTRPTLDRPAPRWLALAVLVGCSSAQPFVSRPMRLVSAEVLRDEALTQSRTAAAEGDFDRAQAALTVLLDPRAPDALSYVARVMSARLHLAQDRLPEARARLDETPEGFDHALDLQRDLVRALLLARSGAARDGLRLVDPLVGRMIDRAQSAEVSCVVAELEANNSEGGPASVGRALRALAEIEAVSDGGVVWLPTGLSCDRPAARASLFQQTLRRDALPEDLAAVIDRLPEGSPRRREVALRLRQIANRLGQIARWERWLGDLPYDEAAIVTVVHEHRPATVVLGVLAPISGPRTSVGVDIVREAQLALREDRASQVIVRDEGASVEDVGDALEWLIRQQPTAIVGPSQEELSRAVVARAALLAEAGVTVPEIYLLAPHEGATESATIHLAGPSIADRAVPLVAAVRQRGTRVVWGASRRALEPNDIEWASSSEYGAHVRTLLEHAGVTVVRDTPDAALHLVVGPINQESASMLGASSGAAPTRWIFDARSALPGMAGVWVGLRAGGGFDAHLAMHCAASGTPPRELGMLTYDAATMILARARGEAYDSAQRVIASRGGVSAAVVGANGGRELAASRVCPLPPHYDPIEPAPETDPRGATAQRAGVVAGDGGVGASVRDGG